MTDAYRTNDYVDTGKLKLLDDAEVALWDKYHGELLSIFFAKGMSPQTVCFSWAADVADAMIRERRKRF